MTAWDVSWLPVLIGEYERLLADAGDEDPSATCEMLSAVRGIHAELAALHPACPRCGYDDAGPLPGGLCAACDEQCVAPVRGNDVEIPF